MSGQIEGGVGQLGAIRFAFKVEIDARALFGDKSGQRGFACLPRA